MGDYRVHTWYIERLLFNKNLKRKAARVPRPTASGGEACHSGACSVSSIYRSTTFRHCTRCSHVVPNFPESAAPEVRLSNLGTPFQQVLSRVRLELPSDGNRTVLRVTLDEQVNVGICNLQRHNLVTEVVGSLSKQLSYIVFHCTKNRVSVLGTPHEVILARTNRMRMTTVLLYP